MWEIEEVKLADAGNIPMSSLSYRLFHREPQMLHHDVEFDDPDIRFDLFEEFENVLERAGRRLRLHDNDRVGVLIRGVDENGLDVQIGVPFRLWTVLTPDVILNMIELKLNSAQTLLLDITVTFSVIRQPVQANFNLQKKTRWRGDLMVCKT